MRSEVSGLGRALTLLALSLLDCAPATGPERCLERSTARARAACFAALAAQTKDAALCQRAHALVPSPDCFSALALATHDPQLCSSIDHALRQQRCLLALSEQDHRPEPCRLIENLALRDSCYLGVVAHDPAAFELCGGVTRSDDCYRLAALHARPQLCQRVGTDAAAPLRRACFDEALQPSRGFARSDCLDIDDLAPKEECFAQLAARTGLARDCDGITHPDIADACWYHGAGKQPQTCARIQNSDLKQLCALDHWHESRAPELCGLLGSSLLERACSERSGTIQQPQRRLAR